MIPPCTVCFTRPSFYRRRCYECWTEYRRELVRKHETGDGSRRTINTLIEFIPRDRVDRETCIETLLERGVAYTEEVNGRILWSER